MPEVTVVIPNWNGKDLLASVCLPSLALQTFTDFSITVVDNGSTDGSVAYLKSAWPGVDVIELTYNSGFASAVNRGIESTTSGFVALANNDVELDSRWLEEMMAEARRQPGSGSFACRMMDFADRTLVAAAGDCVSTDGSIFPRGWRMRDLRQFNQVEPVFSACAGAALYRREALEIVGPFDEDFFAYFEDVDWGFRAQLAGFSCWYVPTAVAYHVGGATGSKVSAMRSTLLLRNAYLLLLKDFPLRLVAKYAPRLSWRMLRRFYLAFRHDRREQGLTALSQAIRMTPRMIRKRRQIQSTRRASCEDILSILSHDAPLHARGLKQLQALLARSGSSAAGSPD